MFERLKQDLDTVLARDPAVHSRAEVFFCYPGFKAVRSHRRAHKAYLKGHYFLARLINFHSYKRTGIDIHPGAKLGQGVFIDHGTGIVIGETTEIGNNVKLYQGVTLGALSTRKGQLLSGVKRHPTIRDNVTIYSNASILGGETVIGANSTIGGNSFITESVPPNTRVSMKNPELTFKGEAAKDGAQIYDWII